MGCATACYPTSTGPAARLSVSADGQASVSPAGHEISTGADTTVGVVAVPVLARTTLHKTWLSDIDSRFGVGVLFVSKVLFPALLCSNPDGNR
jgi:CO/xanthine dehydrogenase Mo-binding subunit